MRPREVHKLSISLALPQLRFWSRLQLISGLAELWGALRLILFGGLPQIGLDGNFNFYLKLLMPSARTLFEYVIVAVGVIHLIAYPNLSHRRIVIRKLCTSIEFVIMLATLYHYALQRDVASVVVLVLMCSFQLISTAKRFTEYV